MTIFLFELAVQSEGLTGGIPKNYYTVGRFPTTIRDLSFNDAVKSVNNLNLFGNYKINRFNVILAITKDNKNLVRVKLPEHILIPFIRDMKIIRL